MEATVSNFHYGAVTPVAAFLMAWLGAALGLRCTTRAIRRGTNRIGWLALGAVSIGCGIWTMHFIAMAGFTIDGMSMKYDSGITVLSLLVAIAVVAVGVFLVGFRGTGTAVLTTAGVFTGLGVAAMHYLGMAAMRTPAVCATPTRRWACRSSSRWSRRPPRSGRRCPCTGSGRASRPA